MIEQRFLDILWPKKHVLDLGCAKGDDSLYFAERWATVDAVDNCSMPMFLPTDKLITHPHITFYSQEISDFLVDTTTNSYDLIIGMNILLFLEKDFLQSELIPFADRYLLSWGHIICSYFLADDPILQQAKKKVNFFIKQDFIELPGYELIYHAEYRKDDDHPPYGKHRHHLWICLLQKG